METAAFDYDLPDERIAQEPLTRRDAARLLVDEGPERPPSHHHVRDLPDLLEPGDLLVLNTTRVLPARLPLRRPTGGAAEVLLLEPRGPLDATLAHGVAGSQSDGLRDAGSRDAGSGGAGSRDPGSGDAGGEGAARGAPTSVWEALVRPSRKMSPGTVLVPAEDGGGDDLRVVVGDDLGEGRRLVELTVAGDLQQALERHGRMPLPPYITAPLDDPDRYQTVYAERPGSAAAPTAGLHLTDEVLARCAERGIGRADVELVVGLGTFRPISADVVTDHVMHEEAYVVPEATMEACRRTHEAGGRVIAVGTTAVRALESAAATGRLQGRTALYIHRPYEWQVVDRLMTNFHLPRSSLLVMIDAFVGPRWRDLYAVALAEGYRFLSFGDAMLLSRRRAADESERVAG